MEKTTATAQEIRHYFLTDDIQREVKETVQTAAEHLRAEDVEIMINNWLNSFSREEMEKKSDYDRIIAMSKAMFLTGYAQALDDFFTASESSYKELFGIEE